jgi:hypothetical protein
MPKNPDPRAVGPKPPFPEQPQSHPGTVHQLKPKADHGEDSYKGSGKLAGQCAIVTGADSGIGRAVAIAFAREGADVVLSYLEDEEADAREVVAIIKGCGRKAVAQPGDIGSPIYARSLVETAIQELGGLDIVVNNAGFQMTHPSIGRSPTTSLNTLSGPTYSVRFS